MPSASCVGASEAPTGVVTMELSMVTPPVGEIGDAFLAGPAGEVSPADNAEIAQPVATTVAKKPIKKAAAKMKPN
ncbi:hypothetical protein CYMTET_17140 [Cymbomonas tetramitiformis]|uniref:Uncharacterized protein n=1 Tax=Cymbomonas tetramitiformis TaxID=36881 RepID=A0AAE0GAQ2_9CHLO|nr:hypothetical protein CYMTET_17140 [Cymbomonas tetramitiformis]